MSTAQPTGVPDAVTFDAPHGVKVGMYGTILYPLTPCCSASGKGSQDGVVCRSCYELMPDVLGDAVESGDYEAPFRVASWISEISGQRVEPDAPEIFALFARMCE